MERNFDGLSGWSFERLSGQGFNHLKGWQSNLLADGGVTIGFGSFLAAFFLGRCGWGQLRLIGLEDDLEPGDQEIEVWISLDDPEDIFPFGTGEHPADRQGVGVATGHKQVDVSGKGSHEICPSSATRGKFKRASA